MNTTDTTESKYRHFTVNNISCLLHSTCLNFQDDIKIAQKLLEKESHQYVLYFSAPSFTMQFNITMDQQHSSGTLTPEEKTSYKDMFKTQLDGIFSKINGTKVVVKNIRLDE